MEFLTNGYITKYIITEMMQEMWWVQSFIKVLVVIFYKAQE